MDEIKWEFFQAVTEAVLELQYDCTMWTLMKH